LNDKPFFIYDNSLSSGPLTTEKKHVQTSYQHRYVCLTTIFTKTTMSSRLIIVLLFLAPSFTFGQQWSLEDCIKYAREHNLALKMSEQNIRLSEANEMAAWGGLLPSLNAQAGHGYNWGQRIDPFTNQFASSRIQSNNFGIASNLTLFGGLQQYNSWRQAEINTQISEKDFEKAQNDMALNLASAYLNILLNKEFMEIAKGTLEATTVQANRIAKLYEAGQVAQGNLNDIQAQQAADQASFISAQNNFKLAKLNLMQLLQLDLRNADSFDIVYPEIDITTDTSMPDHPMSIVNSAVQNFPEIKSAQLKVASAQLGKKIAFGSYSPSLNASFSYGTGYSGAAMVASGPGTPVSYPIGLIPSSGEMVWSVPQMVYGYDVKPFGDQLNDNINKQLFFTLSIPLFNGLNARAANKRAEISAINAELQLQQTKQDLEQSIYKAHADAVAALSTYQSSVVSVEASQKSYDWVKVRYEQGSATAVEYNDAVIRLQNAEATLSRSKYEYIFKLKVLEFYEGKSIRLN
jgi:outer membrane protein